MTAGLLPTLPQNGLRVASVYSGCGGLDLGFARAGFETIWANDLDPAAVQTHNGLLGDAAVAGDIDQVDWPSRGSADLVIGGPPCQGFSVAGKMDPGDPRSQHVFRFLDFVAHLRPEAFVMENVKALAVSGRWESVREGLVRRARRLGYRTSTLVLPAADFGVAQRRERMFMIGVQSGDPPRALEPVTTTPVTVREAFETLPAFGLEGNRMRCTAGITPAKRPVMRPTPYRGSLLFNGNGRPLRLDAPAPTLPASMGGNATPIVDQRELETAEPSWIVEYHLHLLNGGTPTRAVPQHLRRITVEEAAALQSFPRGMEWFGTNSARYRQIGNAVPPLLAFHVAVAVAGVLGVTARQPELAAA